MRVIDVERLHDIRLSVPNPAAIAEIAALLAGARVNIDSVCCEAAADRTAPVTCHLLVSAGDAASRTLRAAGLIHEMRDVAVFTLQNRPGTLAAVIEALNDAGIQVDFLYQATMKGLVIGAPDADAVVSALREAGSTSAAGELAATG